MMCNHLRFPARSLQLRGRLTLSVLSLTNCSFIVKLEWLMRLARAALGTRPISAIAASESCKCFVAWKLARDRLRAFIGSVFRFALATGRASGDPTAALSGALLTPTVRARAAIVDRVVLGGTACPKFAEGSNCSPLRSSGPANCEPRTGPK